MGSPKDVKARLVSYLVEHVKPGDTVNRTALAQATGLTEHQVTYTMSRLLGAGDIDGVPLARGRVWRIGGEPVTPVDDGMVHLEIVKWIGESAIVRDGDGTLFTLEPLGNLS